MYDCVLKRLLRSCTGVLIPLVEAYIFSFCMYRYIHHLMLSYIRGPCLGAGDGGGKGQDTRPRVHFCIRSTSNAVPDEAAGSLPICIESPCVVAWSPTLFNAGPELTAERSSGAACVEWKEQLAAGPGGAHLITA